MIVLLAVLVYAAREPLFSPLVNPGTPVMVSDLSDAAELQDAVAPASIMLPDNVLESVPAPAPGAEPRRGRIRKNSSLYLELTRLGVSPQEIDGVARSSRKTYNLKRVRPGQRFAVYQSATGELDSLEFMINAEQHLKVRRGGNGKSYTSEIEHIPFEVSYHVTQGIIQSSIFAALQRQGAETELASGLDEIFGWTIDFISDIRKGDSFTILYQRKSFEDGRSTLGDILAARVVNRGQEHHAFKFEAGDDDGYYDLEGKSLQKSLRRSPLKFTRVTSSFSNRRFHPVYKTYKPHYGVDYGAPRGTPVYATGDGLVEVARRRRGNGNYVRIKHNNTYTTYYLHLNGFAKGMRKGKRVKQGQLIGYVGSTGAATATHVCYRIKRNNSWVNPRRLKLPSKSPVSALHMAAFGRIRETFLYRMQEPLLEGLENNTVVVDRPRWPAGDHMQTLF